MPLTLIRSSSNRVLWERCAESFLEELGEARGPTGFPAHLWIAHRAQRDALYRAAVERGVPGWLAPPVSFLSELPGRFGIEARPVGLLTGRLLVARTAARVGRGLGMAATAAAGPARAHMLDRVFSELLPEGVSPASLRRRLSEAGGDAFERARDEWVSRTYAAFLEELQARGLYDPRSVHALLARRIADGGLPAAIGEARRLHVFGVTSLRGRVRLFRSLARQAEVEVLVYLPGPLEGGDEWEDLGVPTRIVPTAPGPEPAVQPAADGLRETAWVARRVKRMLRGGEAEPHEIAVVARTGREDTRLAFRALEAAGVPATARLRLRLAEIPALRALLDLFAAEARNWPWRALRQVLASPYFRTGLDLRAVDAIAAERRIRGLEGWEEALRRVGERLDGEAGIELRRRGVRRGRVEADLERFAGFRETVAALTGPADEREWIDRTLAVLGGERFPFRRRLCRAPAGRWDPVRWDQRGVVTIEALLREWRELVDGRESFEAEGWHDRLRRLLEANELALSTPLQAGVQVLEAHEAALTPFRHVFVIHANDGVFPHVSGGTGVFTEEERRKLRAAGLPLTVREEGLRRERLLWRAVVGGGPATLTYRTADAAGTPRLPSLLVPSPRRTDELPRTPRRVAAEAGEGSERAEPVSEAEGRRADVLRLAAHRRAGKPEPFRTAWPGALRHAVLGAFAEDLRCGRLDGAPETLLPPAKPAAASLLVRDVPLSQRPHPWNGELRDPVVRAALEERFGPGRVWSAGQLEAYARRPFDFLVERVLRLAEVVEAEEETTPLTFGGVAHALLERFYTGVGPHPPPAWDARAETAWETVSREVLREYEEDADRWLGLPPLWRVTRGQVLAAVETYLRWELGYLFEHSEVPVLVEHAFGRDAEGPPVELEGRDLHGRPVRMRLGGRIDRVDRHGEGEDARLRVLDYKSGSTPGTKGYADGVTLQSALYMAVLRGRPEGRVECGRYRAIRKPADPMNGGTLKWKQADRVLQLGLSIPSRVRAGLFEANQAASAPPAPWQPGAELIRGAPSLADGTRFDRPWPAEAPDA